MNEAYEKSLQMMRYLGIRITKKQYNQLAVRFNLLSAEALQYISQRSFERILREAIKERRVA